MTFLQVGGKLTSEPSRIWRKSFRQEELQVQSPRADHVWHVSRRTKRLAYREQSKKEESSWRWSQREIPNMRILWNHSGDFGILLSMSWKAIRSVLVSYYCLMLHNKQSPIFNGLQEQTLFFTHGSVSLLWRLCFELQMGLLTASISSLLWDSGCQSMVFCGRQQKDKRESQTSMHA